MVEMQEQMAGSSGNHGVWPNPVWAEEQLAQLMNGHERPLWAFLYSLLQDSASVQDCLQDTYMRAYVQLKRGGRVETAWLYRVGYNRAMDEIRKRCRVGSGEVDGAHPSSDIDRRLVIEEALSYLLPLDRQVLLLHVCAGFKTDEIGTLLGVSGAAVRQRLYRARDRFRRVYETDA